MDCQIREVTEENYPYKGHLFCAKCGSPLTHRIYSNGNRMSWDCSGRRRHGKEFCDGIHVPDTAVRQWKFDGNIYISVKDSRKSIKEFSYTKESSWSRRHKKKEFVRDVPELTEENYPYYRSIFCAECGSRGSCTAAATGSPCPAAEDMLARAEKAVDEGKLPKVQNRR